jgi:hypothetical protein
MNLQQINKMDLKTQIKQTLLEERQNKLKESFVELLDIDDKVYLVERSLTISHTLLEDGFSVDEIKKELSEYDMSGFDKINWKDFALNSSLSMFKEYIIEYILKELFGTNKEFAHEVAVVFSNLSPTDLLKPFKDEASCSESMPKITKALLVALGRHLAGNITGTGESTLATRGAGNLFGQAIMQSNVGESLSVNFCKMIH